MKTLFVNVEPDENGRFPVCPYCEASIRSMKDYRSHYKLLSNMHIFCCPECNRVFNTVLVSK